MIILSSHQFKTLLQCYYSPRSLSLSLSLSLTQPIVEHHYGVLEVRVQRRSFMKENFILPEMLLRAVGVTRVTTVYKGS